MDYKVHICLYILLTSVMDLDEGRDYKYFIKIFCCVIHHTSKEYLLSIYIRYQSSKCT